MDTYKLKQIEIIAEKLECDIKITDSKGKVIYVSAENYLIKGPDGQVYPADKRLFEFLFEKEELL